MANLFYLALEKGRAWRARIFERQNMQLIYVDLNAKDPHYVTILTCYKLG